MTNQWVRLWLDMPNDPKWRTIARHSGQPISAVIAVYVHMLTCAANATERGRTHGWNDEHIASALDMEETQIAAIRQAMQGRVLDGDLLLGWPRRQPIREDNAADRARAWREAKKAERNRTQPNATERPEEDADTEKKEKKKDGDFVFSGDLIRLRREEYLTWKGRFTAFADFDEELRSLDNYCRRKLITDWFPAVEGMLSKKHRELLEKRYAPAKRPADAPKSNVKTL